MILFLKTVLVWNKGDLNREIARESKKIIAIPRRSCELIVNKINNNIWDNLEFSKGSWAQHPRSNSTIGNPDQSSSVSSEKHHVYCFPSVPLIIKIKGYKTKTTKHVNKMYFVIVANGRRLQTAFPIKLVTNSARFSSEWNVKILPSDWSTTWSKYSILIGYTLYRQPLLLNLALISTS